MYNISRQYDDGSRSKNRGTGQHQGLDTRFLLLHGFPAGHVVIGQQYGIIHCGPQLDAAHYDITHEHHGIPCQIRHGHVKEDSRLNRHHDNHWYGKGPEAEHDNQEHTQHG